jgi:hypothetical protein
MHLDLWKIVVAAAIIAASIILYRRTYPPIAPARRALLLGMRVAAFALLALTLVNPAFVSRRVEVRRPLVLALLDRSRSMGIGDRGGATRLDEALAAVAALRRELAGSNAELKVVPFSDALAGEPLSPDSAVAADGEGTDIRGALEKAVTAYRSQNLSAIVLLTDGRVTRGMISSGAEIPLPVYAVGFGDTLAGPDLDIADVVADRFAYRGTEVAVEAVIRASGFGGSRLAVRLLERGAVKDRASVPVTKDFEIVSVPLRYEAAAVGEHRLAVEVLPMPGEERRENNVEPFRLDVLKEKVRVLYLDQFPDWNMTFVRDLVGRSARLEVDAVSSAAGKGWMLLPGNRRWTPPSTAAALAAYDLVVVSDDARLFSERSSAQALASFVNAGGSVLFIADENSPLARPASFELLAGMLPVRRARGPRIEYVECFVRASAEAFDDPVASTLERDGALDALPPLAARIAGLVPSSLARVPLELDDGAARTPFLALERRGEGLSAVLLGFPLWRWRLAGEAGARAYESFLGGLVQYLAAGANEGGIVVDADRGAYRLGDRVRLTASVGERRPPEGIRAEVRRAGKGPGSAVRTVVLQPDPRRPGRYRAELEPLPPGEYAVTASEIAPSGPGMSGTTSFSVEDLSVEYLDTSRDAAYLARVAAASGGASIDPSGIAALVPRLRLTEERIERTGEREPRGSMLVFAVIVGCLAVEWALRKAWGLV